MNKLLVVYNICGISGRENVNYYINSLNNIIGQEFQDFSLVISSCMSSENTLSRLRGPSAINNIRDRVPVNVSFNHTVLESVKRFGEFEGYLYVDSGINFGENQNVLTDAYSLFSSGPYGMVVCRTNTDTGFHIWLGLGRDDNDSGAFNEYFGNHGHYIIPVGRAVNLHAQIFSHSLIESYGKLIPDIFAGQCTESVFSFLNAAIGKQWVIHKDIEVSHHTGMDMPSAGFSPYHWQMQGRKAWDHPFGTSRSIIDIINDGVKYGMGYEELQGIIPHNPEKYDENGFALDKNLAGYIRDNLFLKPEEFDYSNINSEWIE